MVNVASTSNAVETPKTAPPVRAGRWSSRAFYVTASALVAIVGLVGLWMLADRIGWTTRWGADLALYSEATSRLFSGGSWYEQWQLGGPYPIDGSVLYPPVLAWFMAPWLVLPGWTFVAIPVAILGWTIAAWHPAPWTWPILTACLLWPMTPLLAVYANPGLWVAAFLGLALRYQWPGVLVLLKPSLAPFALVGIRSRGWWIGFAALALLSLPFLTDTLTWPNIVMDAKGGGLLYSVSSAPLMVAPLVAWFGVRNRGTSWPSSRSAGSRRLR